MEFTELIKARYSVRKLQSKAVEADKLEAILEAARVAPTACNNQPQKLLVVQSAEAMAKLAKCTPFTFNAPLAIIVCVDMTECWERPFDGNKSGEVDAAIVGTHIVLKVAELGLGTTWVGYFDPAKVKAQFALPDTLVPVAVFPIGYPASDAAPAAFHTQRKPLEETVQYL